MGRAYSEREGGVDAESKSELSDPMRTLASAVRGYMACPGAECVVLNAWHECSRYLYLYLSPCIRLVDAGRATEARGN